MYNKIIGEIDNKNVAILGFGREGISTYKFIRNSLKTKKITIIDKNINLKEFNSFLNNDPNLDFVLGENYLNNLEVYDLIIKTPGVRLNSIDISEIQNKITSQTEFVLKYYKNNVIGITGTKGKSTTSSLLAKVIKDQNENAYLLGNIGVPIFDYIEKFDLESKLVIELSAHQLEFVTSSPHIGIVLNLYEEHLDAFKSKDDYYKSKMNMFKYQNSRDYALYTSINETLNDYMKKGMYCSKLININSIYKLEDNYIYKNNEKIYDITKSKIVGDHVFRNIMFVLEVSELLNLNMDKVFKSINEFEPLEHRMEFVLEHNGVKYYNDSIATIPEATINCINSLKDVDTLIFGGMDRGIDYSSLISFFNNCNVENFICMPETGTKIGKMINRGNVYFVTTLKEAVNVSLNVTKKCCVMSPAAPSYNAFKNFEEKGTIYKELLKKIN